MCFQVSAVLPLTGTCNGTYNTKWTVARTDDLAKPIIENTTASIETSYHFLANTIDAGLYKVQLTSTFTQFQGQPFIADFVYVQFNLTGLIPKITDKDGGVNPTRTVFVDVDTVLDSSGSEDPAEGLPSVANIPMERTWNCQKGSVSRDAVENYIAGGTPLGTMSDCNNLVPTLSSGKQVHCTSLVCTRTQLLSFVY